MKNKIILTLLASYLTASTITVVSFKENNSDILHLSLKSKDNINCKISTDANLSDTINCNIKNIEDNTTISKNFEFFDMQIYHDGIKISPKTDYKMYCKDKAIYDKKVFSDKQSCKSVDILFSKNLPNYLKSSDNEGLNFDIDFKNIQLPYIDVLNSKLLPINNISDANKLEYIKKSFLKKDYDSVIKKANRELNNNNIYASEILLYKLRALDKLLQDKRQMDYSYQDMLLSSERFIDDFPSHKDLTEVLYYKIKSLFNLSKNKEAYIQTSYIASTFPNDEWSQKARLLKAKKLFKKKNERYKAYKITKNILASTKFPKIALESAYILTGENLKDKDTKLASEYLQKILSYDKNYLNLDQKTSYEFAKRFATQKDYKDAVKIAQVLLSHDKNMNENLLKDLALWQDKAGMKEKAYKTYKEYLKTFPDGQYSSLVKEKLDKVLLDIKDNNISKKLKDIDNILQNYKDDPIAKKALIAKAKLYLAQNKYDKVLELAPQLKDINQTIMIDKATKNLIKQYLDSGQCIKSIKLVDNYTVPIDSTYLYKLAKCYHDSARFKEAFQTAKKYIKSQSFNNDFKWYYLAISSAAKNQDYNSAITLYEDLLKLLDGQAPKSEILFDVFDSYFGLKYYNKAEEILAQLEKTEPKNPKLLDKYYDFIKYYKNQKIDLSVIQYATKLINLQKSLKVQTYSPLVDILLIKSLKNLGKYKKALSYFADAYLTKSITDTQKAQLLYLAGEISIKQNNIKQAKEFFLKCGTDVKDKMWQKLCSDSLKFLEN